MESITKPVYVHEADESPDEFPPDPTLEKVEELLQASRTAPDEQVALDYAQRAADVSPDDPQVQESVQHHVFHHLNDDAFVAFLAETEKHYIITFRTSRPVAIPKARKQPEIFPTPKRTEGERAIGMLWWLILGLVPAGIGALVLSPLTIGHALDVLRRDGLDSREKRMAWVAIFVSCALGFLGLVFALLLTMRLIG
jgi:hypothetical protein